VTGVAYLDAQNRERLLPHGAGPEDVGDRRILPVARYPQPFHLRHERVRHRRGADETDDDATAVNAGSRPAQPIRAGIPRPAAGYPDFAQSQTGKIRLNQLKPAP